MWEKDLNSFFWIFSDTKFKCMSIFRRTEDVLEIQEGPSTSIRGKAACDLMQDNKLPFVTLLSMKPWIFENDLALILISIFELNFISKYNNYLI